MDNPAKSRRKADILIILIILGIAAALYFPLAGSRGGEGREAVISVNGEEYARLSLDKDVQIVVETGFGRNIVEVRGGEVFMPEADCPDKLCVRQHAVKLAGETIVCLPNRVVVEITGGKETGLDAVSGRR